VLNILNASGLNMLCQTETTGEKHLSAFLNWRREEGTRQLDCIQLLKASVVFMLCPKYSSPSGVNRASVFNSKTTSQERFGHKQKKKDYLVKCTGEKYTNIE